jgi:hypothetical protein
MSFCYRGHKEWIHAGDGLTNGAVIVPAKVAPFRALTIVFSDGLGWDHVSISTPGRCPNWEEMCFAKDLFWGPDDVVMQLHPAKSNHINNHPHCLHLWRPHGVAIPQPPAEMVGTPDRPGVIKGLT